MDNDFKYLLDAGLDDNAKQHLQNDLNNIKDLAATISKLNLSNDAVAELKQSLQKNGIDLDVLININKNQVRQAQQAGQQIGQQIQRGIQDAIQKGDFKTEFRFDGTKKLNDTAQRAKKEFEQLGVGIVTVHEEMKTLGDSSELQKFTVNIQKTNGSVESLTYALKDLEGQTGRSFQYIGGSINDNGVVKQINAVTDAISSYKQKVAQFKSTNEGILSGINFTEFNNAMTALENGTGSINAVKNAYKDLGVQASNITKELSGQLSKAGSAVRNIAKGDETIASLKAELNGLNNVPKEITTQLNGLGTKLTEIRRIESENGRNTDWAKAYREWKDEVDVLTAKLRVLQKEQANASSEQIFKLSDLKASKTPYMSKVENTVDAQMKYVQAMARNNGWTNVDVGGIERADGMIKKLTVTYTDAEGAVKRFNMERRKMQGTGRVNSGLMQVGDVQVIKTATKAEQELASAMADGREKAEQERIAIEQKNQAILQQKSDNILSKASVGDYDVAIQKQIADLQKYGYTAEQAESQVFGLTNALKTMSSVDSTHEERIAAEEKWQKEMAKTTNTVSEAKLEWQGLVSVQQRLSKANQIESFLQKNTRITKEAKAELERYVVSLRDVDTAMSKVAKSNIDIKFQEIQNSMRGLNRLGYALSDQLKQAASSFTQWISVSGAIMAGVYKIRQIPQEVLAVNNAMIELTKVSDASAPQIANYFDTAAKNAKDLGASVSDVINATADWSRLGYNLPDSEELARVATIYKNVGDGIDIDTANKSLTSTLRGFQLEASQAMEIVDKFNEVANRTPIDTAGIGEALQRSAASFYAANTDLSKSIALITAANSVVQDPTSVGTMWKTVSMRIRGAKTELEDAGLETEGLVESTSQLRDLVKGITGFDIMKDDNTFKDIYEIIVGIGEEWKNLTDIEQASLLEALAGKRQGNALSAALENVTLLKEAYQIAENSAGSALKEQEAYEKGVQFSLDRLSASFQTFSNHLFDADAFKFIVDSGNAAINVIDKLTQSLGSFGTLGMIGTGIASAKGYGLNVIVCKPLFIRSHNNAM